MGGVIAERSRSRSSVASVEARSRAKRLLSTKKGGKLLKNGMATWSVAIHADETSTVESTSAKSDVILKKPMPRIAHVPQT